MRTSGFDPVLNEIINRRLRVITIFIIVMFSALILRLWFLQIINGPMYKIRSENNRIRLRSLPSFRGLILDRNGNLLVDNRPSFSLNLIPEDIRNEKQLFDSIEQLIPFDRKKASLKLKKVTSRNRFKPVEIKKNITREELAIIEANLFNLPGARTQFRPQRNYVYGSFASHIIGYLGEISEIQLKSGKYPGNGLGDFIGQFGVEKMWQDALEGAKGAEQVEVDVYGRKLRTLPPVRSPVPGYNIYLTIDKDLQLLAENCLKGKEGAIVALDPNNGEVLAMASAPAFDPNKFIGGISSTEWNKLMGSKKKPLLNRAITGGYSPGSVFKIVTSIAGLEEGIIDPEEEFFCNGTYKLGNYESNCWKWDKGGHGKVNLHKAIRESCDVYFYKIGLKLGIDNIAHYARAFGLGQKTNIDLANEYRGLIPDTEWKRKTLGEEWQQGETMSCAIGQSYVTVTPIQLASLISTVFNGGRIYQPKIVKSVGDDTDKVYEFNPGLLGILSFNDSNIEKVKNSLIAVVNEAGGTGDESRIKGITVAGKTGTVQVIGNEKAKNLHPEGDVPDEYKDHAWFAAIAPAEEPRIAVAVLVEHGEHSSASALVSKKLIMQYLKK